MLTVKILITTERLGTGGASREENVVFSVDLQAVRDRVDIIPVDT